MDFFYRWTYGIILKDHKLRQNVKVVHVYVDAAYFKVLLSYITWQEELLNIHNMPYVPSKHIIIRKDLKQIVPHLNYHIKA